MAEARIILRQCEFNCEREPEQAERGVLWLLRNKFEDTLSVKKPKIELHSDGDVTNERVLSLIAQVFGPVGVVCPYILLPKLMLQRNVEKKIKWDEPWTLEEEKEFLKRLDSEVDSRTERKTSRGEREEYYWSPAPSTATFVPYGNYGDSEAASSRVAGESWEEKVGCVTSFGQELRQPIRYGQWAGD
ncbi:unnamed protein product [Orchesella dallaii]|uniref:Uncharacterized protein n=1 Tax=Orchesella dallaii TaxID=48710 RepID=A0ABP1PT97_9HEXA